MDPIKTAVKFALVPLRTLVELGELYLGEGAGEQPPAPERREPVRQQQTRPKSQQRRPARPDPQASQRPKDLDDVGLARKVETVIFRDTDVPKGKIDVNAAAGVVWLRGEAKTPEMIKALEHQAKGVPEVREVENLLHLPKTPAPTRITR